MIVIGAEPEGRRFIAQAAEQSHEITLIEPDEDKARQVLKEHSVRVLKGSMGEDNVLQEADIDRADALIATTYDDAKNLMAIAIAKENNVKIRVSLVNHQSHQQLFKSFGAKVISDPAGIIASHLYQALDQ